MNNIDTNFRRFYRICKEIFSGEVSAFMNFPKYPVAPKINDLQLVASLLCMEALSIDSENLPRTKIKNDYASLFLKLIDRSRFNRRRKRLHSQISRVQELIPERLKDKSRHMIVDSVPVPVIKLSREKSYRAFKKNFESAPSKGYSAVNKSWFIGYKLHVIIYYNGVVQQSELTKGNVHDISFLKSVQNLPTRKMLLGDSVYISNPLQASLFDDFKVELKVPFRMNQHAYKKHPKRYKSKRQMVETFFAQMCDEMNLRRIIQRAMMS